MIPFSFAANKVLIPTEKDIETIFATYGLETDLTHKSIHEISSDQKQRITRHLKHGLIKKLLSLNCKRLFRHRGTIKA